MKKLNGIFIILSILWFNGFNPLPVLATDLNLSEDQGIEERIGLSEADFLNSFLNEELGRRKYRLTLDDNNLTSNPNMTIGFSSGQLFSLHPRARTGSASTIAIADCKHLLFNRFNVYAGDGHLFFISGSAGLKFLDSDIMPREDRVIMNNADGFHCQSNSKGIYLERCSTGYYQPAQCRKT